MVVIRQFLLINNIMRSKKNQQVYIRYFLILAHKTPFEITPITFTRAHNEKKTIINLQVLLLHIFLRK